jgi:hypothetical protein
VKDHTVSLRFRGFFQGYNFRETLSLQASRPATFYILLLSL